MIIMSTAYLSICIIIFGTLFVSPCTIISDNSLRTVHIGRPSSVIPIFYNVGEMNLRLFWIDENGKEVFFRNLSPGEKFQLNSFIGHAWRLRLQSSLDEIVHEVSLNENHLKENTIKVGKACYRADTDEENEDFLVIDKSDKLAYFHSNSYFDKIYMPSNEAQLNKTFSKVPCGDILNWISRVVVVPGYHILCVTANITPTDDLNMEIDAWKDGYLNIPESKRYNYVGETMTSFREHVENILEIERNDDWYQRTSYRQKMRKEAGASMHEYMPSSWTMFDTLGNEIKTMENIKHAVVKQSVILIFEGFVLISLLVVSIIILNIIAIKYFKN